MVRGYRIWLDRISTSYGTQPTNLVLVEMLQKQDEARKKELVIRMEGY